MRKNVVFLILLVLGANLFSLERSDFDRVVDFQATIKALSTTEDLSALSGRLLLLSGTISNMVFVGTKKDNFNVEVSLVAGEWLGLEDIGIYNCVIIFEGSEFFSTFPRRLPRNPKPGVIGVNDSILVLAKALQPLNKDKHGIRWLLQGLHVRSLK